MLADALLLTQIAVFAALVPLLTRLPIRRLQRVVEFPPVRREPDTKRAERIIHYTELVCTRGRRFIHQLCLTRGLTLYFFLRRAGVHASLVFGAGRVGEEFAAHCWLVRDGEPYLEKSDPRPVFSPMYTFDPLEASSILPARSENARA